MVSVRSLPGGGLRASFFFLLWALYSRPYDASRCRRQVYGIKALKENNGFTNAQCNVSFSRLGYPTFER